jgi:hypothetical protein
LVFVFPAEGTAVAGASGFSTLPMFGAEVATNETIAADETVRIILEWVDVDGAVRPAGTGTAAIPQPLHLDMAVPPGVRSRIHQGLISGGIRVAADPEGSHAIRIQWEPDNLLEELRGGVSRRIIRSTLYFSWLDEGREIQNTWHTSFFREDEIPTDLVPKVTGTWPPAAFQQSKERGRRSFIRRIAEPAVITGAIAVTIYLLYNVRS